jgi:hypothetical protein
MTISGATRARHLLAVSIVTATSLVACTRSATPARPDRPAAALSTRPSSAERPSCPPISDSTVTGSVRDPRLDEISGVVAGHRIGGVLWVEEDSGNDAAIYAVEPSGTVVARVEVRGATNEDWEDLAWANGHLWLGDIGDNDRERSEIEVYAVAEPHDLDVTSVRATVSHLRYEDGPHDAEAMFVAGGTLYVIEKQLRSRESAVYGVRLGDLGPATVGVLRRVATVPMSTVTAADVGPAGIAVRNYLEARIFPWADGRGVASTLSRTSCPVALGISEALAETADGTALYSIPEGVRPAIRYAVIVSSPA